MEIEAAGEAWEVYTDFSQIDFNTNIPAPDIVSEVDANKFYMSLDEAYTADTGRDPTIFDSVDLSTDLGFPTDFSYMNPLMAPFLAEEGLIRSRLEAMLV